MDNKDVKILEKILGHARDIVTETEGIVDAEDYRSNNDKSKSSMFDLLQIGELARNGMSSDALRELNNIPWNQIYSLRNK